jgi:hypothetical protein
MFRYAMIAALVICCCDAKADVTLYFQAPNFLAFGGATSVDPLPISADDFTPTGLWRLSGATFNGAWSDSDETIPPGTTMRDFRIQFYSDNGGLPGDPPFSDFSVIAALANPQSHPNGFTIYDLSVTFPTPLLFSPGANYWFAALDQGPGRSGSHGFFWSDSADGDDDVAQKGDAGWQLFQTNLGFSLIGTVVPEPGSAALAGVAVFLGFIRTTACGRRKRN